MSELLDEIDLEVLATRLSLEGMPSQSIIAHEAGVSQSTVSRAAHRQIKGNSAGARRLWKYTSLRMRVLAEGAGELALGGRRSTPSEVAAEQSRVGTGRRRAPALPRTRGGAAARAAEVKAELAQVAIEGLRDYLNDDFDPQLVIEQLAMLRRAQDPARKRTEAR